MSKTTPESAELDPPGEPGAEMATELSPESPEEEQNPPDFEQVCFAAPSTAGEACEEADEVIPASAEELCREMDAAWLPLSVQNESGKQPKVVASEAGSPEVAGAEAGGSDDGAESAAGTDRPESWRAALEETARRLEEAFERKLAFDAHKERQIDALHGELQTYKRDILSRAMRPLIVGLTRLHDELGRCADEVGTALRPEVDSAAAADILREFQEDVEILLEENGVTAFEGPSDGFDSARQTMRRALETRDAERVGRVAQRLRPGFEHDGKLLMKERVVVYVPAPRSGEAEDLSAPSDSPPPSRPPPLPPST